jgi:hypothetical protein
MTMLLPRAHRSDIRPSWKPTSFTPPKPSMASMATIPRMSAFVLATMIDRFDHHAIAIEDRTFLPNEAIHWLALHMLPPRGGHFKRQGENLAVSCAKGTLTYGIPQLQFPWDVGSTLLPSQLRSLAFARCQGHKSGLDPDQEREWGVISAMRAQWRQASYSHATGSLHICPDSTQHRFPPVKQMLDLTLPHPYLPRPYLGYAWRDIPVLERLALTSRRWMPLDTLGRLPTCALVDAAPIALLPASRPSPRSLWWEFTHSGQVLDPALETFVFPVFHYNPFCSWQAAPSRRF